MEQQANISPSILIARDVEFSYEQHRVLDGVSADISPGKLTALVGPNGSGKSTLLAALARFINPSAGRVELDGKSISAHPSKAVARKMAVVPQNPPIPEGITVFELVSRGRYPHSGVLGLWAQTDIEIIESAMELTGVLEFAGKPVSILSGGQRQRCWIAMALAQQTSIILLDEPTSALDLRYQLEVLSLLQKLSHEHGRTIVAALHDLNLASSFADDIIFFRDGVIRGHGPAHKICTAELIEEVFEVGVDVLINPATHKPVFVPRILNTRL